MDHLTYIMAAYGLAVLIGAGFAFDAWSRMRRARRRLATIDPRESRLESRRQPGLEPSSARGS